MSGASRVTAGDARDLRTEELRARIVWLIRLRWLAAAGVAVVVYWAPKLLWVELPAQPLYLITALLAAYNLVLWVMAHRYLAKATDAAVLWFAALQVSADLVFLTALLQLSGGIENPFLCYYVFHIVIASILLPPHVAFLEVGFAVVLLLGLAVSEASGLLPHHHLFSLWPIELYRNATYLSAVLFVTITMLYFTAMMATAITGRLRTRERQIVQLSESLQARAEELERAYGSLRQLEQEKSEYLYRAAHHLRSPLAAVESMLAVVAEGRTGPMPEKAQEMVARTRERVKGMLDLAHDLLSLSQARGRSEETSRENVDLRRVVEAMEGDFRREASAAGVELAVACSSGVLIRGVPEAVAELLENLVSNAVKYTPAGGRVEVSVLNRGRTAEVRVSDTGIGIPEEEQASLFQEFFRASNAREATRNGTGLGLSIVKAIARAHDAEVQVESRVGAGTTFRVLFPLLSPTAWEGVPW